ncbi:collagen alpha-2(I) chain-like isoform X2 [Planococcus citri]|uniref:collagen alpha-2(I) chain-like isoform X2 n=1 Tax=Planococcus citri TaxID=170843 RepID=UPI0031F93425
MFINIITIISVVIGKIVLAQGEPVPTVSAKNTSSGENDNQFSTCLDILKRNPSVRNGWFRIKPKSEYENSEYALGFEVWCDFYSNETCIYPQLPDDSSLSKPIDVSTVPGEVWIANLGKEISYPFDNSQITILQKTSRTCHQNITVNCKNLVAFYDETLNTFDKSIKTLAWNV